MPVQIDPELSVIQTSGSDQPMHDCNHITPKSMYKQFICKQQILYL
jgi:hypothetical protein